MKIYVITRGNYSDYHIVTATVDPARAEAIRKLYDDRYAKARVEVFDSDSFIPLLEGQQRFLIYFRANGDVYYTTSDMKGDEPDVKEYYSGDLRVTCFARDLDHAVKIASERRAQYLAQKKGLI